MLLLFNFEKKYFDKENILKYFCWSSFVRKNKRSKIDISTLIEQR